MAPTNGIVDSRAYKGVVLFLNALELSGLRDEALGLWVWGVGTWDSRIGLIRFGAFRAARF